MTRLRGGKAVHGASLGILMLETRFPRIPGDMGNARTWPFPVQYRVVPQATPELAVRGDPTAIADAFVAAGRELVASGCDGVATNCGFLSVVQERLQDALPVPVAASSLMQLPMVEATLPAGRRAGIVTICRETLSAQHLAAAGVAPDTPVEGTDGGREFTRAILGDEPEIDFAACREDVLDAAGRLAARCPELGAIVLECTNMTPYAAEIRRLTGLPVFSMHSFVLWFRQALEPDSFALRLDDPR